MHECPECWSICYCDLDDSNDCRDHGRCYHQCPPDDDESFYDDADDDKENPDPAPARPPEPLGSVLDRLADPAADWEQAKADLRTVLTQPVNDPAPEEAATLPKRALRPLTGDALKDACRRLSPPPALEDMDIATPEEAATGTPNSKETTP